MYPGTIVEYVDQSAIPKLGITEVRNKPLFATVFTSDKGTEKWTRISGKDFFDMYGEQISFMRHGQPLLQAAMAINAGAELLCKRVVADDAKLANIGIIATLSDTEVQLTDAAGNKLYLDEAGEQTTEVTETPLTEKKKAIKFSLKSAADALSVEDAKDKITATLADGEYLLHVIADNGRGTSKKRIKIIPNYRISRTLSYTSYTLYVIEGSNEIESMTFSINPYLVVSNGNTSTNISLNSMINANSTQITSAENIEGLEAYVTALAEASGLDSETILSYDPLFGKTNKGANIPGVVFDDTGIDLQYGFGQMLQGGSNGAFGDSPIKNPDAFATEAVKALDGTYDKVIFNLDQYKITAIIDANYPAKVKRAIEVLAAFREDFFYFRDQGLGKTSVDLIAAECANEAKNMFCGTYCQSYDVYDPYTKRQISVTIGYDIAQRLVEHCDNGCIRPPAGFLHDMVISSAIYGTLSFTPTICPEPEGNQKEQLEDLRVNYASYIDNQLVVESLYTSQEAHTQWSYINNVMGIQEVVRAIRTRCPAIRYSFIDGTDLENYRKDVDAVLDNYRINYKILKLEYLNDATYSANKIFYAALKVQYRDFVQTEWFKVVALSPTETIQE